MGLKDSLASMVTDYVQLRKNPEFRSKSDLDEKTSRKTNSSATGASNRRHSLQITCGTQDPRPDACVHQRTYSLRTRVQSDGVMSLGSQQRHQASLPPQMRFRRGSEPAIPLGINNLPMMAKQEQFDDAQNDSFAHSPPSPTLPPALNGPEITQKAESVASTVTRTAMCSSPSSTTATRARSPVINKVGSSSIPSMLLSKSGTFSRFLFAQRSVEEPLFEEEEQTQQKDEMLMVPQKQQQQQQHTNPKNATTVVVPL